MRARIVLAVLILVGAGSLTRADDKPVDRSDLDKRIVMTVYESAVVGTDIFNKGDHGGCFRLYQGTLMAVHPLLDHRPKLQASVKTHLDKAKGMKAAEGAFVLRTALDEVQNEIAPAKGGPVVPGKTTLWDRLGGEKGVRTVVDDFVLAAADDPKVNFLRGGTVKIDGKGIAHLKQMLVEQISSVSGGPFKYTGRDMKTVHKGMGITDAEFNALGGHLLATLKKHKVSDADIDAIIKVIESTRPDIVEKKN